MAEEIERKFLIQDDTWRASAVRSKSISQGYLDQSHDISIRVRIVDEENALLTIKSSAVGLRRSEFEYPIPLADARQLLKLCRGVLVKTRHDVPWLGLTWEIDVFEGVNAGLVIAEIELQTQEQPLQLPPWVGREITGEARYYNSQLVQHPFQASTDSLTSPRSGDV
jgi:adenylate cyclase